jgi:hypothetical protein
MVIVYRLRDNKKYIGHVQRATLTTKEFGIQTTHGLFGSEKWWKKIASGELPVHTFKGQICRVFMGSMGDWPMFEMLCNDGQKRQFTREVNAPELDRFYSAGSYVELDYVIQHFKASKLPRETAHECVIEIRVSDEA